MAYGNHHRMFLQILMNKGILNHEQVAEAFQESCKRFQVEPVPSLVDFIRCIQNQLEDLNLYIVKAIEDDAKTVKSYYVLVSKVHAQVDEKTSLGKKIMVDLSQAELEYLRILIDAIVNADDRQLSRTTALLQVDQLKTKRLSQQEAECVIDKLIEQGWLSLSEDGNEIKLSVRLVAELNSYLSENYEGLVKACGRCAKLVIRPVRCSQCDQHYHLCCLNKGALTSDTCPYRYQTCKACNDRISLDSFE